MDEQFVIAAHVRLRAVVGGDFLGGLAIMFRRRPLRDRERGQPGREDKVGSGTGIENGLAATNPHE